MQSLIENNGSAHACFPDCVHVDTLTPLNLIWCMPFVSAERSQTSAIPVLQPSAAGPQVRPHLRSRLLVAVLADATVFTMFASAHE
jgi:hypothetical protein